MKCDPSLPVPGRICIVDYGMGNISSVQKAIQFFGVDTNVSHDPKTLRAADALILPGVGSFSQAMSNLKNRGLVVVLNEIVFRENKPFLGICLGMQLLAKGSWENGWNQGLGWINGTVEQFKKESGSRVPNVGWSSVMAEDSVLFDGVPGGASFYFDHSYFIGTRDLSVAQARVGNVDFVAAIEHANIFGTQFHPEKSDRAGLNL
jgi:glutamine amidotransferase